MKYIHRILLLVILSCTTFINSAQTITIYNYPWDIAQVLVSDNSMSASQIASNGDPLTRAYFEATGTSFNNVMNFGVILSTGNTNNATDLPDASSNYSLPGDSLLDIMNSVNPTIDASSFTINFLPLTDTFELKYIFASEEFGQLSPKNDRMGIFLSGPKPGGGFYENENFAIIPGTNLPITVDNLLDSNYSNFLNSTGDFVYPYDEPFAYEAYTDEFTITGLVVPGEIYMIKVVIADGVSGDNDSAILLRGGSMKCLNSNGNGTNVGALAVYDSLNCGDEYTNVHMYIVATGNSPWGIGQVTWDNGSNQFDTLIAAGTYTITATDINQYSDNTVYSFTIPESPASIDLNTSFSDIQCSGDSTYIEFSVSGGSQPITMPENSFYIAGVYQFTAIAANNCVDTVIIEITEPDELVLSAVYSPIICHGEETFVSFSSVGGTLPFTLPPDSDFVAGTYQFISIDSLSCADTLTITIEEPSLIEIDTLITPASSSSSNDGAIDLTVYGGIAPYSFNWSNGSNTEDINNLATGIYSIELIDSLGCIKTDSFNVPFLQFVPYIGFTDIIIYPNPTTSLLYIERISPQDQISLFSIDGKLLYHYETKKNDLNINLSEFAMGFYLLRIQRDNEFYYRKIVKE